MMPVPNSNVRLFYQNESEERAIKILMSSKSQLELPHRGSDLYAIM